MNFEFVSLTHPGLVRDNNEDTVACDAKHGIAVLADGMGGYNAGEIASAMAAAFVRSELSQWLSNAGSSASSAQGVRQALSAAVSGANLSIYRAALSNPQFSGMGTTLVVGLFGPVRVMLAHVGDSRCYVWRKSRLTQLTHDHSLLQEQLDAGLISTEQAKIASHKNLVTRALGVDERVDVDVVEHLPEADDLYLLCSDGLTDMVDDEDLVKILATSASLSVKAEALVRSANDAGGRDNISVILVAAKAKSASSGFFSRMLGLS
jgi:protein phosphatase